MEGVWVVSFSRGRNQFFLWVLFCVFYMRQETFIHEPFFIFSTFPVHILVEFTVVVTKWSLSPVVLPRASPPCSGLTSGSLLRGNCSWSDPEIKVCFRGLTRISRRLELLFISFHPKTLKLRFSHSVIVILGAYLRLDNRTRFISRVKKQPGVCGFPAAFLLLMAYFFILYRRRKLLIVESVYACF